MGTPLDGLQINNTYEGLLKTANNTGLDGTLKTIGTGDGDDSILQLSTTSASFGGTVYFTNTVNFNGATILNTPFATTTYVDTQVGNEESARITADGLLQDDIDTNTSDISDLQAGVGNVIGLEGLTGNLSFSGVNIDISTSGTDTIVLSASTGGGGDVTSVNGEIGDVIVQTLFQTVKNVSGGILYRGTPVHATTGATGQQPEVIVADASSNYPADYILNEDINDNASGEGITLGTIYDVDLTPFGASAGDFTEGDEIWLASGGGFTNVRPTGTNAVQPLGRVLKVNVGGNQLSGVINGLGHAYIGSHGLPNLANGYLWLGNSSGVPQETQRITINNLPTITNEYVWKGGAGGTPVAVNQNTLSVYGSVYSDNAVDVKVDSITSGTYRLILGDTGVTAGDYTRLKSNVVDGLTYNTSGGVLSSGALSVTNNITAGGTLIGTTLDISGNADIDGTLSIGSIGNVETEINDLNTFVNNFEQFSPIVNETTSITIDDANYSSYLGKTTIITNASAVDVELDFTSAPVSGDEMYFVQGGVGEIGIINYGGSVFSSQGTSPTSRAQYSGMVYKYVGSGNWLVMGDIA